MIRITRIAYATLFLSIHCITPCLALNSWSHDANSHMNLEKENPKPFDKTTKPCNSNPSDYKRKTVLNGNPYDSSDSSKEIQIEKNNMILEKMFDMDDISCSCK